MSVTADDFAYVRRLVNDETSLALSDDKEYLVQHRLTAVAEREGLPSAGELIAAVRSGEGRLRELLVEALCVHETLFFRDEHPFTTLRDAVVPELLRRVGGVRGTGRLAMWSAATSTGQEAYSLAILARERGWVMPGLRLLATDLSGAALDRARTGRYSELELRRGLSAARIRRWFAPRGRDWQVSDELRAMVEFGQLNLSRPFASRVGTMDVVLLRNVLIYLDDAARAAIVRRMAEVIAPGGALLVGGSESIGGGNDLFAAERIGRTTVYRRTGVRS
jgi:chemotaxis protein methyltransferase CheR